MPTLDGAALRPIKAVLALTVLVLTTALLITDPGLYPRWPTLGGVPVNPELVVTGVLGVVVIVDAVTNDRDVWSVIVGALGVLALMLAASSLHTLYVGDSGVFFGGLFTLAVGVPLALLVLGREAAGVLARWRRQSASDVDE